jgi:hypothetical protein
VVEMPEHIHEAQPPQPNDPTVHEGIS